MKKEKGFLFIFFRPWQETTNERRKMYVERGSFKARFQTFRWFDDSLVVVEKNEGRSYSMAKGPL